LGGTILSKIADDSVIGPPSTLRPFNLPSINPLCTLKVVIKLVKGETVQDLFIRVEKPDVQDAVVTAIPYLKILEKTGWFFFSNLDIQQISGFLVGDGNEVFIAQEGKETDDQSNNKQGESNSVKAGAPCLHRGNLTISREGAEREKGRQEHPIGKGPLKNDLRDFVKEINEDQVERSVILAEEVHLLEKEHDHIDEHQAA
jgi:hypothetical protein